MVDLVVLVSRFPVADTKEPIEKFQYAHGGQTATAMVACSRLGLHASYIGRFGDDDNGARARENLDFERVDTGDCLTAEGVLNGFSVILVDKETGTRTVLSSREPELRIAPSEVDRTSVCAGRTLLVDCHDTAASTVAARYAREAGIPTLIDVERVRPGVEDLLSEIDIIIAAEEFPQAFTGRADHGAALRMIRDTYDATAVCVTLGAAGSLALVGDVEIRTPPFRVPVVDSTGAGDVFRGGFIAGWLRSGADAAIEEILCYANAVAAINCKGIGARGRLPNPAEVEELLRGEAV